MKRTLTCAWLAVCGCTGLIVKAPGEGGPGSTEPPPQPRGSSTIDVDAPGADAVSSAWTRRLTKTELGNVLQQLAGLAPTHLADLPDEAVDYDFERVAQSQTVIDRHVEGYLAIGDEVAAYLTNARLAVLVPACSTLSRTCAQAVIDTLGKRAFRRPADADQTSLMLGLYDAAGTPRDGIDQILRFMVESAGFIYVIEQGTPDAQDPTLITLDDYSLATRLSMLACETTPDDTLLGLADGAKLHDPDTLAAQASRLFVQPCARVTSGRFFNQWLKLDRIATVAPDTTVFPQFTADVRAAMEDEDTAFFDHVTWDEGAGLSTLIDARYSYLDSRLGGLYGITGLSSTLSKVTLPDERRGLFTHLSFLTSLSNPTATSPVRRGGFVYRKVLCQNISPPPPTLDTSPPKDDPTLTTRQRYALRTENGVCATCHSIFNPIGYTLEGFDPIGSVRTTDNNLPIDASGGLPNLGVTGLNGGAQLSDAVAKLDALNVCFAREWLRFGLGRVESQTDVTSLRPIVQQARGQTAMKDMFVSLTQTYAFSHRAVPPGPGAQP